MSRKKNLLNLNEDCNLDYSSSEENNIRKNNSLLKSSNYTISIKSFEESNPKNYEQGKSLSNINSESEETKEDLNDIIYQKETIIKFPNKYPKKQSLSYKNQVNSNKCFINRKKVNPINKKNKKISYQKLEYDYTQKEITKYYDSLEEEKQKQEQNESEENEE